MTTTPSSFVLRPTAVVLAELGEDGEIKAGVGNVEKSQ